MAFSPDGPYLAASSTNTIRLWKVGTGEAWATLKGHSNMVFDIAFLEGGRTLASASLDQTVKLWDIARAGGEPEVLTANAGRGVGALAFTADGRALASVSGDTVTSWDVDTGREHPPLEAPAEAPPGIFGIALSPDGRHSGGRLHEPTRRSCGTWRPVGSATASLTTASPPWPSRPTEAILATGTLGIAGTLKLWDVDTGQPLPTLEGRPLNTDCWLAFSPDGRTLASGGFRGTVRLWDVATGRNLADARRDTRPTSSTVAFSPDGRTLASGSWDGTVKVWDVADAAHPSLRHTLEGHAALVWSVAFSPDGTTLASASEDGTVKLWDPATGRERCTLVGHDRPVRALAFSPDGQVLASGDGGGTIRLWRR